MFKKFIVTILILSVFTFVLIRNHTADSINNYFYDREVGFSNNEAVKNVVIIGIDDKSFKALDRRWPWPREWVAEVITTLTESGASAIGIDISLFDRGFNDNEDVVLSRAISDSGRVTLISRWIDENGSLELYEPLDIFRNGGETGYGNLIGDMDGRIRQYDFLTAPNDDPELLMKSFAYSIYMTMLNGEYPPEENDDPFLDYYTLDGIPKDPEEFGRAAKRYIDYSNMGTYDIPTISFSDILSGNYDVSEIKGKAALIGAIYPESHDQYSVPGTTDDKLIYGVEVHAHALAGLINGSFPEIASDEINLITSIVIIIILTTVLILVNFTPAIIGIVAGVIVTVTATVVIWNTSGFILPVGYIVIPVIPAVPMLAIWHFFIENRERKKIRGEFSRFVAPAVVNHIMSADEAPKLGGERKHVTVLFSDIVSFTTMSEEMEPEEIVSMLNRYFTKMVDIIFKYDGTINKFIGDAIMAVFGAPVTQEDSEERAVMAAIEMQLALAEFNRDQRDRGEREFGTGIGINCGDVVVGNIGSERQMEYTVIGDTVNISARLEGLTRTYGDIVISDDVYQKVKDKVEVTTPEPVLVKGKTKPVGIHVVDWKKGKE